MTDHRERMLEALLDATGENTKSKAIDKAFNPTRVRLKPAPLWADIGL